MVEFDPATTAYLVKEDDGYHVIDADGTKSDVCKLNKEGDYIALPVNAANRQWAAVKKAEVFFAENPDGQMPMAYRATRTIDNTKPRVPNAKLIDYLSEDDKAEYMAIIDRANAARLADIQANKKPMTEEEKLLAKIAKLQASLEALKTKEESDNV